MNSAHAPAISRPGRVGGGDGRRRADDARWLLDHRARILASIAVAAIAAGGIMHLVGAGPTGHTVWRTAVALLAAELTFEVARTIVNERSLSLSPS